MEFLSIGTFTELIIFWNFDKPSIEIILVCQFFDKRVSLTKYLEISSHFTDEVKIPQYAFSVLRILHPFPSEVAVLCHHAEINDVFLHGGRVGPSHPMIMKRVEIFLLETLTL